jgi:hypothetical protein
MHNQHLAVPGVVAGRGAALTAIIDRVGQLVEQHTGGLILVEGEPGKQSSPQLVLLAAL